MFSVFVSVSLSNKNIQNVSVIFDCLFISLQYIVSPQGSFCSRAFDHDHMNFMCYVSLLKQGQYTQNINHIQNEICNVPRIQNCFFLPIVRGQVGTIIKIVGEYFLAYFTYVS